MFTTINNAMGQIDFKRLRSLINRLPAAKFRVMQATSAATRRTSVLSFAPRGSGAGSPVENGVLRIEYAKEALAEIESEIFALRELLKPEIDQLETPLARMAMTMRYIEGYSVRDIAYRLNYSEPHVFRIIARSEKKINKDDSYDSF